MGLAAIILVSVSAFFHAGWNAASKARRPPAAFFLVANTAGAVLLLPLFAFRARHLPEVPASVWGLLAVAGASMALYYAALAGAYRAGEMSVAYPVARSVAVVFAAGIERALGLGGPVGTAGALGMGLVVAGCLLVPRAGLRPSDNRGWPDATVALALLTAVGVAGYSVTDREALVMLRAAAPALGRVDSVIVYAPLEALSASGFLAVWCLIDPRERAALFQVLREERVAAVSTGAAIYATYGLVLVAMTFASNASYVVAFRQLSVPLGALLGVTVLGERARWTKLAGVAAVFAGLVLVAAGA